MASDAAIDDGGTLLYPRAVVARDRLSHNYLERKFLERPESVVAAWFREDPRRVEEMKGDLATFVDGFEEAYDPGAFVLGLPSLRQLGEGLRVRLLAAVREPYESRFRVKERLRRLRRAADAFRKRFGRWHDLMTRGEESGKAWARLEAAAHRLHDLLADPELQGRWIP